MMLMIYRVCQDLPYCGRWIASYYSPCVPSKPTEEWTAAGANFPDGRLISSDDQVDIYSIRAKDAWVEQTVTNAIQARIDLEKQNGSSHYHYFRNKDCREAYARYENINVYLPLVIFLYLMNYFHIEGTHAGLASQDVVMNSTSLCPCVNQVSIPCCE